MTGVRPVTATGEVGRTGDERRVRCAPPHCRPAYLPRDRAAAHRLCVGAVGPGARSARAREAGGVARGHRRRRAVADPRGDAVVAPLAARGRGRGHRGRPAPPAVRGRVHAAVRRRPRDVHPAPDPGRRLLLHRDVFATVGFGDIAPVSEPARLLVTAQMLADLVLIGTIVKVLVGAAQRRREALGPRVRPAATPRTDRRRVVAGRSVAVLLACSSYSSRRTCGSTSGRGGPPGHPTRRGGPAGAAGPVGGAVVGRPRPRAPGRAGRRPGRPGGSRPRGARLRLALAAFPAVRAAFLDTRYDVDLRSAALDRRGGHPALDGGPGGDRVPRRDLGTGRGRRRSGRGHGGVIGAVRALARAARPGPGAHEHGDRRRWPPRGAGRLSSSRPRCSGRPSPACCSPSCAAGRAACWHRSPCTGRPTGSASSPRPGCGGDGVRLRGHSPGMRQQADLLRSWSRISTRERVMTDTSSAAGVGARYPSGTSTSTAHRSPSPRLGRLDRLRRRDDGDDRRPARDRGLRRPLQGLLLPGREERPRRQRRLHRLGLVALILGLLSPCRRRPVHRAHVGTRLGVIFAMVSILTSFTFMSAYPFWSITVISWTSW